MGALESSFNAHDGKRYNPNKRLIPFPAERWHKPGKVLICYMPIQPGLNKKLNIPDDAKWWIDCKFMPYNELHLVTSVGVYIPRPGRTHLSISRHLNGTVCVWKMSNKIVCKHIKGSSTSALPNVQPHPDGENIVYVGRGFLNVLNLLNGNLIYKDKDLSNATFMHCAVSLNGRYLASVSRKGTTFEVSIMKKEIMLIKIFTAFCHDWCEEFVGDRTYTHEVICKFSPDSAYLAVAISTGLLVVVKRAGLHLFVPVIPGMFSREGMRLINTRSFEFDPRYFYRYLTFGGDDGYVYFIDLEKEEVMHKTEIEFGEICCIKHNEVGDMLAVATTEAKIVILSTENGTVLQVLDGTMQEEAHAIVAVDNVYPTVTSLSFNQSGSILASASSDGFVRLWQVQPNFNLQHLCRYAILQKMKVCDVVKLPIPPKLVLFLLQWPAK